MGEDGWGCAGILFSKSRWVGAQPAWCIERVDRTVVTRPYAWRIGVRGVIVSVLKTSRWRRLGLVTWRLRLGSVLAAGKSVEVGRGTGYTILLGFVFLVVMVACEMNGKEGLVCACCSYESSWAS
jgi:hypothetical protein